MLLNTTTYAVYLLSVPLKSILTLPCLVALMTLVLIFASIKFNMCSIVLFIAQVPFPFWAHPFLQVCEGLHWGKNLLYEMLGGNQLSKVPKICNE